MGELPHVHAPQGIHTWRDFFIHIAVVAIGLLLAIGLQQTVEYAHHRHQRGELEARMRETLHTNSQYVAYDLQRLAGFRAYLVEVQQAVASRLRKDGKAAPPAEDSRNLFNLRTPNLGVFEAAKADGSVALLSIDRIRIYDYTAYLTSLEQRDLLTYIDAVSALGAFRKRFDPSTTLVGQRMAIRPADLPRLSTTELVEYQALIGNALQSVDRLVLRLRRLDAQYQGVLNGARDEAELMDAASKALGGEAERSPPP